MGGHNILAIIPARGGSKRLPGKNIKELDGRPLIAYSILVARASRYINNIIVASDSFEIGNIGLKSGCAWQILPEVHDGETLTNTLQLTAQTASVHKDWNWIVLLQPTCPLRTPIQLDQWIGEILADPNCDGGLTVDRDSYKLGTVNSILDPYYIPSYTPMTPKQDIKPQLRENGVFYIFKADKVLEGKPWRKEDRMLALECPIEQSLANVDDQLDWDTMEWLYWKFGYDKLFRELEK